MRPTSRQRGYNTKWDREARLFRQQHPLCAICKAEGRTTQSQVVDHIIPHKGDPGLFWCRSNWQALCFHHHNANKQTIEAKGYDTSIDKTGNPTDPNHPWNKKARGGGKI